MEWGCESRGDWKQGSLKCRFLQAYRPMACPTYGKSFRMLEKKKPGQSPPKATTANEDRYLFITVRHNRCATASQLSCDLYADTWIRVSENAVSSKLHGRGLFVKPSACVPLTSAHRRIRLEWYRDHQLWTRDQCGIILFTDLNTNSWHTFIWRKPRVRYLPSSIRERLLRLRRFDGLARHHMGWSHTSPYVWQRLWDWCDA